MSGKQINFTIDTTLNNTVRINKLIKRGDTLDLEIKVFENGVLKDLTGKSISLILEKSDKTNIEKSIVSIDNPIKITLDVQATNSIGLTNGELYITDASGNISSNTFIYDVSNDLSSRILDTSKNDCETLDQLKKVVNQNIAIIENYKEAIQDLAGTTESTEALSELKKYIGPNLENLTLQNDRADDNIPGLNNLNETAEEKLEEFRLYDTTELNKRVQENTTQLSEIAKTKFYFLPVIPLGTKAPGDCSLIVTKTGKTVLIDTGETESYNLIKAYLDNLGITKIDYLIISHYHPDHINNLSSLMSDFNFSSCVSYIQKNSTYSDETFTASTYYNQVVTALTEKTINYPTNGDTLNIDDITIKFFNCSNDDITYYEANTTNYNDYSMCCQVTHRNIKVLYTGDISLIAQARINLLGYFEKIDLLKVQHHGFDRDVNSDYIQTLQPKYAVVSQSITGFISTGIAGDISTDTTNSGLKSKTLSYLSSIGCKNYIVGYVGGVLFTSNGLAIETETKIKNRVNANYNSDYPIFIYVSKSTLVENPDGTYYKPFRKIQEAIAFCGAITGQRFTIKIADADYKEDIRLTSNSSKIKLLGNTENASGVKINSLSVDDSNALVDSINVSGIQNIIVNINNSNVELNNCLVNGVPTTKTNYYDGRGICAYNSKVYINGCTVSNKSAGICAYNGSVITVNGLSGANNDYTYVAYTGDIISLGDTSTYNNAFLVKLSGKYSGSKEIGTSASRLTFVNSVTTSLVRYWDTTLNCEMLWNGTKWLDNLGRIRDTLISTGNDLNTFTTQGVYVCAIGTIAQSLKNAPSGIGYSFELEVKVNTLGVTQIIKSSLAYDTVFTVGIIYRTYKDSVWSSWYQLNQTAK